MRRVGWIGVLVLAILVVLGLMSFAGAERSDSVWVEADSFYVKNSGVNGYSFTIHVPTSMSSADVHSVTATRGEGTAQTDVTVTKNSKFAYTIPESELTAGQEYRIQIDLRDGPTGYWLTPAFTVVQGTEGNGISLSLSNPDGTIPTQWQTGVQYTLHATVTNDAITGLKVWNGLKWVSLEEGTDQTNVVFEHSGEYTLPAVGIIADGEIWASPLTINATSGDSFSESLKVTVDKYYYEREDNIILTITKPSTATLLTIRFATQELNPKTIYTTTIAAESGTTQTVSIPAEAVGGRSSRAEVRCVAPGYEAKSAQSDFISVAKKDPPSIWLNAPELYIKKANPSETDGYTFSVELPEEVRDVPVTGWSVHVYDNSTGEAYYHAWKQEGDEYTGEFTIPQSALTKCWTYSNLDVFVELEGYKTTEGYTSFSVAEAPEDNSGITITMTDENGDIPENPAINREYTFTIAGSGEINALKIWDGYQWEICNNQVWSSRIPVNDSTCGFAVYGSSNGGATWEAGYTAKVFTLASAGQLAKPVIILNKDDATYTRGEEISITIDRIKYATNYEISAFSDYTNGSQIIYSKGLTTDGDGEGTLTFIIPTEHLSNGIYHVHVWVQASEYKGNMSNDNQFNITEGTTPPESVLKVYPEQPKESDEMMVYAYIPNCEQALELRVVAADESTAWEGTAYLNSNTYPCYYWKEITGLDAGRYTFAVYGSGESEMVLSRTVTIVSEDTPEPQPCGNGVSWTLTDGALEIRKTGNGDGTMTSHPWTAQATEITSAVIGEGVISICEDAFAGCSNMTNLSIPGSIAGFPWAFDGCTALASVYYGGFNEDWGTIINDYYGRDGYTAFQHATFRKVQEVSTAQIEEYSFAFTFTEPDGTAMATEEDESGNARPLFDNYQDVRFVFDGDDLEGYTKTYRLVKTGTGNAITRVVPDEDGDGRYTTTVEAYSEAAAANPIYQGYAVYLPQDDTSPLLIAKSPKTPFQVRTMKILEGAVSFPEAYALGTEGGFNISLILPDGIQPDDVNRWLIRIEADDGIVYLRDMKDDPIELTTGTNYIPIPDSVLTGMKRYQVLYILEVKGYKPCSGYSEFAVFNEGADLDQLLGVPAIRMKKYFIKKGQDIKLILNRVEHAETYTVRIFNRTDKSVPLATQTVYAAAFGEEENIEVHLPTIDMAATGSFFADVICGAEGYTSNISNSVFFQLAETAVPYITVSAPESYTKKLSPIETDGLAVSLTLSTSMQQDADEAEDWTLKVFNAENENVFTIRRTEGDVYTGRFIIPDGELTGGQSYTYTLSILFNGYERYTTEPASFQVLAVPAPSVSVETKTFWTPEGNKQALYITAYGTISSTDAVQWAAYKDSADIIYLNGEITSIGDNAFDGFTAEELRVDFNQSAKPAISGNAFSGCGEVIFRYYEDNGHWQWQTDNSNYGASGTRWIYLPVRPGSSNDNYAYFSYTENGWALAKYNSTTYADDLYPMSVEQAIETSYGKYKCLTFRQYPTEEEEQALYAGWRHVSALYFEDGSSGAFTVSLPAQNDLNYVLVRSYYAEITITNPTEQPVEVWCASGALNYTGNISSLMLADGDGTVTVNGNIQTLNFYDSTSNRVYRGSLELKGTIQTGTVMGTSSIEIPGGDAIVFRDITKARFTNVEKSEYATIIEDGVLNEKASDLQPTLDMYSLQYLIADWNGERKISLILSPKGEYLEIIGSGVTSYNNLDISTDGILYGQDTYISIQTAARNGKVILNGGTEDGTAIGLRQITVWNGWVEVNCPTDWINIDNGSDYNEGVTLAINSEVQSITMTDLVSGSVQIGANGRIVNGGAWIRRSHADRSFGEVSTPGTLYAKGSLNVLSQRDGETLQSLLPTQDDLATAAGTSASAEVCESSEAALSSEESAALNDFLGTHDGTAVAVFDASITSDAGDEITSLNKPVEFTVSNEANDEAFILRLHEETDDQGNSTVTATPVSAVTDAAVIPFESDLFSKYVIVRGTGVFDPDKLNTLVLPADLTRIEANAFEGGAFQAVIIPDSCTFVGAGAFKDCAGLVYVSYKDGTAFEGGRENVFDGCVIPDTGWDVR